MNRPKKVTAKQLTSHYFGFGNINLQNLRSPQNMNKTTGLEGSGKFQQKLHMKQKQIEVRASAIFSFAELPRC